VPPGGKGPGGVVANAPLPTFRPSPNCCRSKKCKLRNNNGYRKPNKWVTYRGDDSRIPRSILVSGERFVAQSGCVDSPCRKFIRTCTINLTRVRI
jgi:hypothetical protein